jgi:hypothetical protein
MNANIVSSTTTKSTPKFSFEYVKACFERTREKNLARGDSESCASEKATGWIRKTFAGKLILKTDEAKLEAFLVEKAPPPPAKAVETTAVEEEPEENPVPTEDAVREYLSSTKPEKIRSAVYEVVGVLYADTRLTRQEAERLANVARTFNPPADEEWIARKIEKATSERTEATKIAKFVMNDSRITKEKKDELLSCLQKALEPSMGADGARAFVDTMTMPQRPARTRQEPIAPMRPRRQTSSALDIKRAPDPVAKVTESPLSRLERELKSLKADAKALARAVRDKEEGADAKALAKAEALVATKEAERVALLASIQARKDKEKASRKANGKKAPVEAKPAKKGKSERPKRAA